MENILHYNIGLALKRPHKFFDYQVLADEVKQLAPLIVKVLPEPRDLEVEQTLEGLAKILEMAHRTKSYAAERVLSRKAAATLQTTQTLFMHAAEVLGDIENMEVYRETLERIEKALIENNERLEAEKDEHQQYHTIVDYKKLCQGVKKNVVDKFIISSTAEEQAPNWEDLKARRGSLADWVTSFVDEPDNPIMLALADFTASLDIAATDAYDVITEHALVKRALEAGNESIKVLNKYGHDAHYLQEVTKSLLNAIRTLEAERGGESLPFPLR